MKIRKIYIAMAFICAMFFIGCKTEDDDLLKDSDGNVLMNVVFPSYEAKKIVRNQVANTSGATIYYEYLTFTSAEGGDYELWSYVNLNDATDDGQDVWKKLDENPFAEEGEDTTLPTEFTYDAATGTVSISIGDSSVSTILFDAGKATYMAAEKCFTEEVGDSLFRTWKTQDGDYTFKNENEGGGIYI